MSEPKMNVATEQGNTIDLEVVPTPSKEGPLAWMQVMGAFILNLNTWGLMNSYGMFQAFYQLDMLNDNSPLSITWIGLTSNINKTIRVTYFRMSHRSKAGWAYPWNPSPNAIICTPWVSRA
ncbi:hypothetical protein F4815DRAFT_489410 [Daldinia loculata]|nr:hypothetical protein F4815DRAFT_489410 [Daldinia loculata]